jgi:phospholipid-binding lipoprotein MlaA
MTRRASFALLSVLFVSAALMGCASGIKASGIDTSTQLSVQESQGSGGDVVSGEDPGFQDPFADNPSKEDSGSTGPEADISDPIEPVNRFFFAFNDKFYFYVAKPVAKGWRKVMPEKARIGLGNIMTNVMMPVRLANNLLQLDFLGVAGELTRFIANSTMGLGGWFDLAAENGLPIDEEDFGQTLGKYGLGHGFYLVMPFLGPSSLRDTVGDSFDFYLHPFNYTIEGNPSEEILILKGAKVENTLSLDKDTYEKVVKESIDPYLFMRNAYYQLRENVQKK